MARVLEGFQSFTCTPTRSSAIGMSDACFCLPSRRWYSFTDPGGMEGWVDLGVKWPRLRFEPATSRLQIQNFTTHPLAHRSSLLDGTGNGWNIWAQRSQRNNFQHVYTARLLWEESVTPCHVTRRTHLDWKSSKPSCDNACCTVWLAIVSSEESVIQHTHHTGSDSRNETKVVNYTPLHSY